MLLLYEWFSCESRSHLKHCRDSPHIVSAYIIIVNEVAKYGRPELTMDYGSNGSPKLHGSWVSGVDPLTH